MPIEVPGKRYGKRLQHSKVFGHGGHGKKQIFADLLITPLVDMFVIIVLFLIANFSATGEILNMTKDIQLPSAQHVKELELTTVIMVSNDEIVVSGTPVGRVAELTHDDGMSIPSLEDKLREEKQKYEQIHAQVDQKAFSGDINIQGHKDVPFKVMKRVMFSCQNAGWGNINFAVLTAGSGEVASAKPE